MGNNLSRACARGAPETRESVVSADEADESFKRGSQLPFYRRQKDGSPSVYSASLETLVLTDQGAGIELCQPHSEVKLLLQVQAMQNSTVRVAINELHPIKERYKVSDVLTAEPVYERLRVDRKTRDSVTLSWALGQHQIQVFASPFRLEVKCGHEVIVTVNPCGRLQFETLQDQSRLPSTAQQGSKDPPRLWKRTLRRSDASKPIECSQGDSHAVGLDLRLHGFSDVYGLPEHADSMRLRDTRDGEPYRLYNLDVYAYPLNSRLGLYGTVPLLLAHKPDRTMGVFWLNASDTLVDIQYSPKDESEGRPLEDVAGQADVCWVSESGTIDCFILLGPTPHQAFSQYALLTGYQALPPLFSLGYHQCRWNYEDEADVKAVDAGFDRHDIPYDVIWLDIEHTRGKRYFTWDRLLFPDPAGLQKHLDSKNRKLVVIQDPHIKVDPEWPLYCEARDGGHFVKNKDLNPFMGSCWPGPSCYLDLTSPHTRAWYARCFALGKYKGSTESLFVWNDMNEPSVFGGPEKTMPKDAVHHGGWEHRDLHNLYGFYQHMASADGLITRSGGVERPFVLSRSFFAGSQRLGAVWTGDNVATWGYLKISIPMLLTLSLAGVHFCGADIGGFVENPSPELLVRWYQTASLQPFFRGHSAKQTRRREPWLFGEGVTAAVREVVRQRYCLLPYWYTLFHLAHTSALPPIRPLWVEFPMEPGTFRVENPYMVGGALLVCPVTDAGVREVDILLPGPNELWYDVHTAEVHAGGSTLTLAVTLDTVPMFQRGGTVVPRRTGCGSSTADLGRYPLSLTVALDHKGCGEGLLYLDDGHSFSYRDRKQFSLRKYTVQPRSLISSCADVEGVYIPEDMVESVIVLGMDMKPSTVTVHTLGGLEAAGSVEYEEETQRLSVGGLNLGVHADWEIHIQ